MDELNEDLRGPWVAVMSKYDGCHMVVVDPSDPGADSLELAVSVVRGTKLPVDGVLPLGADVWDELYEHGDMVDEATVAGEWERARAVAAGLNAMAPPACVCPEWPNDCDHDCRRHYPPEPTDAEIAALLPAARQATTWAMGARPHLCGPRGQGAVDDAILVNVIVGLLRELRDPMRNEED